MNLIRLIPAEGDMKYSGFALERRASAFRALATTLLFFALAAGLGMLSACQLSSPESLTVWTYDSFVSEWGPGASLAAGFEEKTGIKVEFVSKGDGGALLGELLSAGKSARADAVVGLDDRLMKQALAGNTFMKLSLSNLDVIPQSLRVDPGNRLVPFDFGNFAFIWDSESGIVPPGSLEDLTRPEYEKKIIIMDPRTSTPGLGFLAWTQSVYGVEWKEYWKRLAPSILAMTPGWDTGYGLFTKGEAPLVLSYSTSPAYHMAYEETERYRTLVFAQGHPAQIELAGVVAFSRKKKDAEKFIDYLLSAEAQSVIPETQWMYPANPDAALPASFSIVPRDIVTLASTMLNPAEDPETAAEILAQASR